MCYVADIYRLGIASFFKSQHVPKRLLPRPMCLLNEHALRLPIRLTAESRI